MQRTCICAIGSSAPSWGSSSGVAAVRQVSHFPRSLYCLFYLNDVPGYQGDHPNAAHMCLRNLVIGSELGIVEGGGGGQVSDFPSSLYCAFICLLRDARAIHDDTSNGVGGAGFEPQCRGRRVRRRRRQVSNCVRFWNLHSNPAVKNARLLYHDSERGLEHGPGETRSGGLRGRRRRQVSKSVRFLNLHSNRAVTEAPFFPDPSQS